MENLIAIKKSINIERLKNWVEDSFFKDFIYGNTTVKDQDRLNGIVLKDSINNLFDSQNNFKSNFLIKDNVDISYNRFYQKYLSTIQQQIQSVENDLISVIISDNFLFKLWVDYAKKLNYLESEYELKESDEIDFDIKKISNEIYDFLFKSKLTVTENNILDYLSKMGEIKEDIKNELVIKVLAIKEKMKAKAKLDLLKLKVKLILKD